MTAERSGFHNPLLSINQSRAWNGNRRILGVDAIAALSDLNLNVLVSRGPNGGAVGDSESSGAEHTKFPNALAASKESIGIHVSITEWPQSNDRVGNAKCVGCPFRGKRTGILGYAKSPL